LQISNKNSQVYKSKRINAPGTETSGKIHKISKKLNEK
jgi:hypothetical protein